MGAQKLLKIGHVGSFQGNVGDQLNHAGFRPWFEGLLPINIEWKNFEVREMYRGNKHLYNWLLEEKQDLDLIVFGGGNFWELWPTNSRTGTSLDITIEELVSLGKPCFFNSIGVDSGQGISPNASNFGMYMKALLREENFFVTVRNDGAQKTLKNHLDFNSDILELPDHGFFSLTDNKVSGIENSYSAEKVLALNFAADMPKSRFVNLSYDEQLAGIIRILNIAIPAHFNSLVVVPHTHSDFKPICDLIERLPDKLVRENLKIASLSTSYNSHDDTLKSYFDADLIISNRFHSNIISIVLGKKFMPLINYPQIRSLFGGLPKTFPFPILDESCPEQWEQNFLKVLHEREENYEEYRNLVLEDLSKQRNHVEELLLAWLTKKLLK